MIIKIDGFKTDNIIQISIPNSINRKSIMKYYYDPRDYGQQVLEYDRKRTHAFEIDDKNVIVTYQGKVSKYEMEKCYKKEKIGDEEIFIQKILVTVEIEVTASILEIDNGVKND
jgi:hypothetical protein